MNTTKLQELKSALELMRQGKIFLERSGSVFESMRLDEQYAYDNMAAEVQESETGEDMQLHIEILSDLRDTMCNMIDWDAVEAAIRKVEESYND